MTKHGREHKVRILKDDGAMYASRIPEKIEAMCDEMQADGWDLLSVSWPWPNERTGVLVFARPKRKSQTSWMIEECGN